METLKELQAILDNAPEGATHYDEGCYYMQERKDILWFCYNDSGWVSQDGEQDVMRSLADIQRIVDLMKQLKLENEK